MLKKTHRKSNSYNPKSFSFPFLRIIYPEIKIHQIIPIINQNSIIHFILTIITASKKIFKFPLKKKKGNSRIISSVSPLPRSLPSLREEKSRNRSSYHNHPPKIPPRNRGLIKEQAQVSPWPGLPPFNIQTIHPYSPLDLTRTGSNLIPRRDPPIREGGEFQGKGSQRSVCAILESNFSFHPLDPDKKKCILLFLLWWLPRWRHRTELNSRVKKKKEGRNLKEILDVDRWRGRIEEWWTGNWRSAGTTVSRKRRELSIRNCSSITIMHGLFQRDDRILRRFRRPMKDFERK